LKPLRSAANPIIQPKDVKPSRHGLEVFGVFNPGVARLREHIVLLLRVAEKPIPKGPRNIAVAAYDTGKRDYNIKEFSLDDDQLDLSDPRLVVTGEQTYLTSISHLRVARSTDGLNFQVEEKAALACADEYETYGIEDPRISLIDGRYYITYVAVCPCGVTTCLASTEDFESFKRHGVIFCPENKDVVIFPEKAGGRYYALHRPVSPLFGTHDIWIAESSDLVCWGNHRRLISPRPLCWDAVKIGASAVPVRTETGWLEIYHGVDQSNRYCLGALLLERDEPWKVVSRAGRPILEPQTDYECEGVFGNVVFSCGLLCEHDKLKIYYGAADTSIAYAEITLREVFETLEG